MMISGRRTVLDWVGLGCAVLCCSCLDRGLCPGSAHELSGNGRAAKQWRDTSCPSAPAPLEALFGFRDGGA
eukprot:35672-Rhodomonas_salina.2